MTSLTVPLMNLPEATLSQHEATQKFCGFFACRRDCSWGCAVAWLRRPAADRSVASRRRLRLSHLPQSGTGIRTVQGLPGHADVSTTMICLHVHKRPGAGASGPLDFE